jgi:CheY-like chemotaxis protein
MKTQGINILLVEDDEVDVMNVRRAFSKNNILNPLYVASNGLEALNMLKTNTKGAPPAISANNLLIVLDMNMPKMGGIEFLQELRKDNKLRSIPVVILTTSNQERERVEAYQFNIAGYIIKPVVFSKFVETIAILNKYWTICEMP